MRRVSLGFGFGFRLTPKLPGQPTPPSPTFEGALDFSDEAQSGLLALILEDF